MNDSLVSILRAALAARISLFDARHDVAFRLFHGFTEGNPNISIDLYGTTLVIHDYAANAEQPADPNDEAPPGETIPTSIFEAQSFYRSELPWLTAVLLKSHKSSSPEWRNGRLLAGESLTRKVRDPHASVPVWYAIDLTLNRDASLYLDSRCLREWITSNVSGKRVLNTFAYTGSLGVAAKAAGAQRVIHVDLNRSFLNVAKTSYTLNGFPIEKSDFQTADFWPQMSHFIHAGERFDCVLLDPPIFAATRKGVVDVMRNYARVINKVRPLVAHDGHLVVVNNGVFASGGEFLGMLELLSADGYMKLEEIIPVHEDFVGYENTRVPTTGVETAPFNHSTKIAVLKVQRKDALTHGIPTGEAVQEGRGWNRPDG